MSRRNKHLYEFGPFRLDTEERVLLRGDNLVPLTPKAFETLHVLVRNRGHIMEKDELLKEIWAGTFVEEATLAQNIFTLRRALGNGQNDGQKYIETIPRRGYRFIAEVREIDESAAATTTNTTAASATVAAPEASAPATPDVIAESPADAQLESASPQFDADASIKRDAADASSLTNSNGASGERANVGIGVRDAIERDGELNVDVSTDAAPSVALNVTTTEVAAPDASFSAKGTEEARTVGRRRPVWGASVIAASLLVLVAVVTFGVYRIAIQRQATPRPPASFQSMKVTRLAINGKPREASISPDGKYVAYVSEEAGQRSIWVKQATTTGGNAQQIVAPSAATLYAGLVFSPYSEYLYYVALSPNDVPSQLFQVPVFGGAARKLAANLNSPITFSPDGKQFAFARADFDKKETSIVVADAADGANERQLTMRRLPEVLEMPAWSPDGKVIVCALSNFDESGNGTNLLEVQVNGGGERLLSTERWFDVGQIAWLSDASAFVLNATEQELSPSQVWRLAYPSGETRRITNDLNSYFGTSLSNDASTLVTLQTDRIANLWTAPAADADRATQITFGPGKYDGFYGVSWMPDGRIVYASVASGSWDIWAMNADGSNAKQLTVNARSNYGPAASNDGRFIVFVSNRAGNAFNIWRMDTDGSNPKQLTFTKGENFPHVTPDNKWVIYATVGFSQPARIWKVPIDGGEPVAITDTNSSWPVVSPDGTLIACTYETAPNAPAKLVILPIEGGQPIKTFDLPQTARANTLWTPDGRAVTYLDSRDGPTNIWSQPLDGTAPRQLTHFKTDGVGAYGWSLNGKQLVYSRGVETTGVVLIKDFN
ncbi:MAG TPA: winged helix-turn-helix domain-containing protein [Pyrinomonadaceae bacterium]|jgi:Tol biopolymer transport system component/DNA-binding winged helix-turn-helix (wHTH) protein